MWSFNIFTHSWAHYDFTQDVQYRPNSGSYAEARDQALSFFLNGIIESGSSTQTMNWDRNQEVALKGMVVIDHKKQTARNISTESFSGNKPRSRGRMQFLGVGENGIIVHIGGKQKDITNTVDTGITDLVGR